MAKRRNDISKEDILQAALQLATARGYQYITRDGVAAQAGVATGLVNYYFGTVTQLKRDVMRHAVKQEILPIVAYGLAIRDPHALKASDSLRRRAAESTCGS